LIALQPNQDAAVVPLNVIANARAPMVPREEAAAVPIKYYFKELFDCSLFTGCQCIPPYDASGNKETVTAEPQEVILRKTLVAHQKFQIRHGLTRHSGPVEYANAFVPATPNPYNPNFFSIHQLTVFTNIKAQLTNAGPGGIWYAE
jgi:hypothetical protein